MEKPERQQSRRARKRSAQTWKQVKLNKFLITILVILTWQVSITWEDTYWTYFPNPPMLAPVTWEIKPVLVWINSSIPLGGRTKNLTFQQTAFNYVGLSRLPPLCASQTPMMGCLHLENITKKSSGKDRHNPYLTYRSELTFTGPSGRQPQQAGAQKLLPLCMQSPYQYNDGHIIWRDCAYLIATSYQLPDSHFSVSDWAIPYYSTGTQLPKPEGFVALVLTPNIPIIQGDNWRLWAASDYITHLNSQTPWGQDVKHYTITACVQAPSVILVGGIQISKAQSMSNISCPNCHLTNCIDPRDKGQSMLVLRQPPYVVIPTTIEGPWYDDPGI
ncbi:PREDICTED: uncharacterized protein LOC109378044 [Hipposideros armiger]|uniref:Uncharacterized protein LOC109378044 n=1 Tax=Hipposideros armiger TaxID=186990 RepID=A0A8B7QPS7_HIPAR|nr:PREDICTED: uncharacterized protein LOC109378044 [Hipposideros armiger]